MKLLDLSLSTYLFRCAILVIQPTAEGATFFQRGCNGCQDRDMNTYDKHTGIQEMLQVLQGRSPSVSLSIRQQERQQEKNII